MDENNSSTSNDDSFISEDIYLKEYSPSVFQEIRDYDQVSNIYLRDLFETATND